jgi:hypothetical protein
MTITLEQVQANGGWYAQPAAPAPSIAWQPLGQYDILNQIDDWTTVVGGRGRGVRSQQALITSLDSVNIYFDWSDDGDYVNTTEYGCSDPMYVMEWSPYGSQHPTRNPSPFQPGLKSSGTG